MTLWVGLASLKDGMRGSWNVRSPQAPEADSQDVTQEAEPGPKHRSECLPSDGCWCLVCDGLVLTTARRGGPVREHCRVRAAERGLQAPAVVGVRVKRRRWPQAPRDPAPAHLAHLVPASVLLHRLGRDGQEGGVC